VSELLAAQRAASAAAVRAGATPESRPFAPHLTLGRSRDTRPAARLAAAIRAARDRPVGELRVDRVVLVESTLTPAGPVYHERRDWALAADAGLGDQRAPEDVAAGGAFVRLPLSAP
jgi:2'-5' RNA ligase